MYKIQKRKNRIIFFKKNLTRMVCVVLLAMVFVVSQAQLFNAFEAHIINVTAKIINVKKSNNKHTNRFFLKYLKEKTDEKNKMAPFTPPIICHSQLFTIR